MSEWMVETTTVIVYGAYCGVRKKYHQQNITSIISQGIISQEIISQYNNIAVYLYKNTVFP